MGNYNIVKDWRRNTKMRLVKSFGGKCGICGYNKSIRALDFHHLDPGEKDLSFSSRCISWKKIVAEVKKCVMICSNCHREVHDDITTIPENIQRFDENLINQEDEKIFDNCPICGIIKPSSQKTCSKQCGAKIRYKVDWEKFDLKLLYKEIGTMVGVAAFIGNVSDNAVRKRLKKEGLL